MLSSRKTTDEIPYFGTILGGAFSPTMTSASRYGFLLMVTVLTATLQLVAQPRISGVINHYTAVTRQIGCDSAVIVTDASAFAAGNRVLLIQMKGAQVHTSDNSAFGSIIDYRSAGHYEFLEVLSANGNTITFTTRFVHAYDVAHAVQLIRVPTFDNVIVDRPVVAKAWDGVTGGVVAIHVRGTLGLSEAIRADSAGFRGGNRAGVRFGCYDTSWTAPAVSDRGGLKGEGAVTTSELLSMRAPLLQGAGGGNGHNAGGGGGGNGGRGGRGGNTTTACSTDTEVGGHGGYATWQSTFDQRLFLGGGGGGGHENRPEFQGTDGANGGGIVIVHASNVVVLPGGRLSAVGGSVRTLGVNEPGDGSGGGGAGGTMMLDIGTVQGILECSVRGGGGGGVPARYQPAGPGGGGAGGTIVATKPLPVNTTVLLDGGPPGIHVSSRNAAYNQHWGATHGEEGVVIEAAPAKVPQRYEFFAEGQLTFCPDTVARLQAKEGFLNYRWSNGARTRVLDAKEPGEYFVSATDSSGCDHTFGPLAVRYNLPEYELEDELDFGPSDILRTYTRSVAFRNTDDDDIHVDAVTVPDGFTLLSPAVPFVVAAGSTANMVLAFRAVDDKPYGGFLHLSIRTPCAGRDSVLLSATVKPLYVQFSIPDTVSVVGQQNMLLPVYMRVLPDTVAIRGATLDIDISMDNRLFAPDSVTQGEIVRDIVDVLARRRSLTVRIQNSDLIGGAASVVTRIGGTVLSSVIFSTPLTIDSVRWVQVVQEPITTWEDGLLVVEPPCYPDGRAIRTYRPSSIKVLPNPASEHVTITAQAGLPGTYDIAILDVAGRVLRNQRFEVLAPETIDEIATGTDVRFDVNDLPSGIYLVRYSTPVTALIQPVVIER